MFIHKVPSEHKALSTHGQTGERKLEQREAVRVRGYLRYEGDETRLESEEMSCHFELVRLVRGQAAKVHLVRQRTVEVEEHLENLRESVHQILVLEMDVNMF